MTIELATPAPTGQLRPARATTPHRRAVRLAAVAIVALGISGCGDDDAGDSGSAAAVDVTGAWARSSPAGVTDGAAYLTIESAPGDQLIGAAVPADVAATAELHETVTEDATSSDDSVGDTMGHEMGSMDDSGAAMTMRQVTMVELPAGEAVDFAPGGLHVMLIDLAAPLVSGSSFELTLTFAEAEPLTVNVEVRDEAP